MIKIRRNVFETNSSSTHSLIMCSGSEYDALKNGEALISDQSKVITKDNKVEDVISKYSMEDYLNYCKEHNLDANDINIIFNNLDDLYEEGIVELYDLCTLDKFFDNDYLESFTDSYTTKSGEEVVAFGLYGYDG